MGRFAITFAGACALLAGACGDDAPSGPAVEEFGALKRAADCERQVRCGLFSTADACIRATIDPVSRDIVAAVNEGLIKYNGAQADACIAALMVRSCNATSEQVRLDGACARVFTGAVADGEACAYDAECISGTCNEPSCTRDMCCMGTCQPTYVDAAIDSACGRDADCVSGAFCGTDKLCHALGGVAAECRGDNECAFGLACIGATELQAGRCRDLPAIGEQCPYQRCAEIGATCKDGTCVAYGAVGSPCTTFADCSPRGECAPDGTCQELPQLGMPCTGECALGSWCNAGTCSPPREMMEQCNDDDECADRYCAIGPIFDYCDVLPVCF